MASPEDEPAVLRQALEVLKQTELSYERPNPIEPFMREIFLPKTLTFIHAASHILRSFITSGRFIGGVVGTGIGHLMGEPGVGIVAGVVLGELVLKPTTFYKARNLAKMTFRFINSPE